MSRRPFRIKVETWSHERGIPHAPLANGAGNIQQFRATNWGIFPVIQDCVGKGRCQKGSCVLVNTSSLHTGFSQKVGNVLGQ